MAIDRREVFRISAAVGVGLVFPNDGRARDPFANNTPDRFLIVAVEESDSSLGFYDSSNGAEVGRVRLSLWPHEVSISPDGSTAFVSNFGLRDYDLTIGHAGNSVSAVNIAARCEMERYYTCSRNYTYWGPHGVKVSPDGALLYVNVERVVGLRTPDATAGPGMEATKMLVFELATRKLKTSFSIVAESANTSSEGNREPRSASRSRDFGVPRGSHNFVFSPDGTEIWMFLGKNGISRINPVTGEITARVTDFNGSCRGLAFTSSGKLLVSATNEVAFVDPRSATIEKKIGNLGVGQILYSKATPDERHVLAPAVWEGQVLIIESNSGQVKKRISTGVDPVQIEIAPDKKRAYVTHGRSNWLSEIDLATFSENRRIRTKGGPNGVAFAPWSTPIALETINFGACLPFTGSDSAEGREARLGLQFWQDRVNASGGMLIQSKPHRVEIHFADTKSSSNLVELDAIATELVTSGRLMLLFGSIGDAANLAVANVAERKRIPMVTAFVSAPDILRSRLHYSFGVMTAQHGTLIGIVDALRYALAPNPRTVALVHSDVEFDDADAQSTARYTRSVAMESQTYSYRAGEQDFTRVVATVQETDPDILLHFGTRAEAMNLINACRIAAFVPGCLAFNFGLTIPLFRAQLGNEARGLCGAVQWSEAIDNCSNDRFTSARDFSRLYFDEFSESPSQYAAGAAACGVVFEDAIHRANSLEADKIQSALTSLDLQSFYGLIRFNANHTNEAKPIVLTQLRIRDGKTIDIPVWPRSAAANERPEWPMPAWIP